MMDDDPQICMVSVSKCTFPDGDNHNHDGDNRNGVLVAMMMMIS